MIPLELHYTSAEQGLGGSPGFQFVKLSPGLDPGICRQIESLLAYEPPRTAPSQPTPAQIADFPIALSHTLLADGAAVLCNATYTGTDYSGRFGNFYAHALYLPGGPGDLGTTLPIDTWGSPSWRTTLSAAGLPAAHSMEPGVLIARDVLLAFTSERRDQLAAVLTDIMNSFGRHRRQVILAEDDAATVALWIATACHSLPRPLAQRLTFTTYTRRPYHASQQVVGIMPGADFAFTHTDLTARYRVHAQPGQASPPTEPATWAVTAAALWLAGRPELFDEAYAGVTVRGDDPGEVWPDTLTGQLAATALAAGADLPQAAVAAAVAWATANVGARRNGWFWPDLAAGIAGSPDSVPLADLARLCQRADALHPPDVTAPLLAAYLSRLPAEIAKDAAPDPGAIGWIVGRLHRDPDLARVAGVREPLQAALSGDVRIRQALLLLRIADAAGIEDPGRVGETVLGPALLAGGESAAEVAAFLRDTANAGLRTRVLDFLEDAARGSDGRAAARLVSGVASHWLASADLSDFPLLGTATRLAAAGSPGTMAAFRHAAGLLPADGPYGLRYAYGLTWPDQPPTLREACELASGEEALRVLEIPGAAETFVRLIRDAPVIGPEAIRLASLLRTQITPRDPRDRPLLDLVAMTGRLRAAAAQPGDAGLAQEMPRTALHLLAAWPYSGPPRDAAATALLALLTEPSRLENGGPVARAELQALVASGAADLIAAFAERVRVILPDGLTRSPRLHANCFVIWRLEHGRPGDEAWPAVRDSLMADLLAPAARRMDDTTRQQTARLIAEQSPGLSNEWLQLIQPRGPMARLSLSRFLYRRTQ
jgi:GTPase-associated protein 1, C-terminal domain/GTPase-associated protein 1, N-terminal domain type 2/GTPase-associated protein 1, middle domain